MTTTTTTSRADWLLFFFFFFFLFKEKDEKNFFMLVMVGFFFGCNFCFFWLFVGVCCAEEVLLRCAQLLRCELYIMKDLLKHKKNIRCIMCIL